MLELRTRQITLEHFEHHMDFKAAVINEAHVFHNVFENFGITELLFPQFINPLKI